MIENYKGWDIDLICIDKNIHSIKTGGLDQSIKENIKWIGVNFMGEKIYGRSLKEIRHIIDYPVLYIKK